MSIINGGQAFPVPAVFIPECGPLAGESGMTLRDWFAGQALSGLCSTERYADPVIEEHIAFTAYAIADAMLKTRID
jgi:hypothetical protein